MTKDDLLTILKSGAKLHQSEMVEAADYRADQTTTEYLLTSALLRAARSSREEVRVEALCKKLINPMTTSANWGARRAQGKMRFDVLIGDYHSPRALAEVKIGVRSGSKLIKDVDKMLGVVTQLDKLQRPVAIALVFETHAQGSGKMAGAEQFEAWFGPVIAKVQSDIQKHLAKSWPGASVEFHLLSKEISPADIVDGIIEEDGCATFISAAIFEYPRKAVGVITPELQR